MATPPPSYIPSPANEMGIRLSTEMALVVYSTGRNGCHSPAAHRAHCITTPAVTQRKNVKVILPSKCQGYCHKRSDVVAIKFAREGRCKRPRTRHPRWRRTVFLLITNSNVPATRQLAGSHHTWALWNSKLSVKGKKTAA